MSAPRPRDAAVIAALARRLGADHAATLSNFAWFAARRGHHPAAVAAVRLAVALPDAPRAAWRSLERLAAGRSDGLLLALDGAPIPRASSSGSPLAAAVSAHRQAEFAVAEACYRAATSDPTLEPLVCNGLAVLHEQRGEHAAADEAWDRAIAFGSFTSLHNRALADLLRGAPGAARARLAPWVRQASPPAFLSFLSGFAALSEHDPAGAVPLLEAAIAAEPDLARAHFTLGLALERLGAHARALSATRRALLLSPWYLPLLWLVEPAAGAALVEIPAEGGDRAATAATDDVLLALGRSLLEVGHLSEALAVFDQVLLHQPSQTAALFHRGVVLAKLRRYGEALDDWDTVGRVDPDGPLGAVSRRHARSARELASLFIATGG